MKQCTATATIGGGCFWCLEAIFKDLKGVCSVIPGYSGGQLENPTYKQVCTGETGHAEVIQITYDEDIISFQELLEVFFSIHDPTSLNRQGGDIGSQYRSVIFYSSLEQEAIAKEVIATMTKLWDNPIVTELAELETFYSAEDYHHDYFAENPSQGYCQMVIAPKVVKFRKEFQAKLN